MSWLLIVCYLVVAAGVVVMYVGSNRRAVLVEASSRHRIAGDLYLIAAELLADGQDEASKAVAEAAAWHAEVAEEYCRVHGIEHRDEVPA